MLPVVNLGVSGCGVSVLLRPLALVTIVDLGHLILITWISGFYSKYFGWRYRGEKLPYRGSWVTKFPKGQKGKNMEEHSFGPSNEGILRDVPNLKGQMLSFRCSVYTFFKLVFFVKFSGWWGKGGGLMSI